MWLLRIHEYANEVGLSRIDIAKMLSVLIKKFLNKDLSSNDIINIPDRFYILRVLGTNEVMGFISILVRDGKIGNLVILPKWRRKGLAKFLIKWCEKIIKDNGGGATYAYIKPNNKPSINLFKSMGYMLIKYYDLKKGRYVIKAFKEFNMSISRLWFLVDHFDNVVRKIKTIVRTTKDLDFDADNPIDATRIDLSRYRWILDFDDYFRFVKFELVVV